MSFSKCPGNDAVCYMKPLDSLKNWNDRFFWVDTFACPASFLWNTSKGVPKDPFLKSSEFNAEHYATLTTVGRVVLLLLVAPARASNELEASVDKLFDEGDSGDGQGTDIQPIIATTDTIVEELALLQPRRQRKRKYVVVMLADLRILLKS
nr:transposase (putative), gypsy type [Tanacetum cinerariifolium]